MRQTIRQIQADINQAKRWGHDASDLEAALGEAKSARRSDEPAAWHRVAARNDRDDTATHYWVIPRTEIGSHVSSMAVNPTGWTATDSPVARLSEPLADVASNGATAVAPLPRSKPRIWAERTKRRAPYGDQPD